MGSSWKGDGPNTLIPTPQSSTLGRDLSRIRTRSELPAVSRDRRNYGVHAGIYLVRRRTPRPPPKSSGVVTVRRSVCRRTSASHRAPKRRRSAGKESGSSLSRCMRGCGQGGRAFPGTAGVSPASLRHWAEGPAFLRAADVRASASTEAAKHSGVPERRHDPSGFGVSRPLDRPFQAACLPQRQPSAIGSRVGRSMSHRVTRCTIR